MKREEYRKFQWLASVCIAVFILSFAVCLLAFDRATMLNLMTGLNGYTLCSGIICEELNGDGYTAVPFAAEETMTIGYLKRKGIPLSHLGSRYIEILKQYEKHCK